MKRFTKRRGTEIRAVRNARQIVDEELATLRDKVERYETALVTVRDSTKAPTEVLNNHAKKVLKDAGYNR